MTDGLERVFLDQIVDRDGAFMIDVPAGAADRRLIERDCDELEAIGGLALAHRVWVIVCSSVSRPSGRERRGLRLRRAQWPKGRALRADPARISGSTCAS